MNKFKEGDWVRSIVDRYSRTSYMKPCKVMKVIDDYLIKVTPIDYNEVWEVESKNFDYVPLHEMLHKGDIIRSKLYPDIEFTFLEYLRYGVRVENGFIPYKDYISFDNIIYKNCFKV